MNGLVSRRIFYSPTSSSLSSPPYLSTRIPTHQLLTPSSAPLGSLSTLWIISSPSRLHRLAFSPAGCPRGETVSPRVRSTGGVVLIGDAPTPQPTALSFVISPRSPHPPRAYVLFPTTSPLHAAFSALLHILDSLANSRLLLTIPPRRDSSSPRLAVCAVHLSPSPPALSTSESLPLHNHASAKRQPCAVLLALKHA